MKKGILFLTLTVSLLSGGTATVSGQSLFNRKKLRIENDELKSRNALLEIRADSLSAELEKAHAALDSLMWRSGRNEVEADECDFDMELCDSLLKVWYIDSNTAFSKDYDMETERFSSAVSDEEFRRRLDAINSFIPLTYNETVRNYCILYSERMPAKMSYILGLSEYYWPMFDEIFSFYGVPLELKALAVVESFLRPTAVSRVGATGLWQFMYRTSRSYELRIDSWMDERMDPVKSTRAAAMYLRDAYKVFGDWQLAIASYNCGFGGVNKAIRRSGGKRSFWDIYDYLPRETRGYVPAFTGALYALHYYKEYGLKPSDECIEKCPVDTFHIRHNLHFAQIEEVIGVPVATVQALNPQYIHDVIPGDSGECVLRLPVESTASFIQAGDSLYVHNKDKYLSTTALQSITDGVDTSRSDRLVYKVKSGDVLGRIAKRYGVTVAQLKKWNSLKNDRLRIGQKLVILRASAR